jgi:hypothetical protein
MANNKLFAAAADDDAAAANNDRAQFVSGSTGARCDTCPNRCSAINFLYSSLPGDVSIVTLPTDSPLLKLKLDNSTSKSARDAMNLSVPAYENDS